MTLLFLWQASTTIILVFRPTDNTAGMGIIILALEWSSEAEAV